MKTATSILAILVATVTLSLAQITENPSVKRKSTNDVYINKVEITDEFTIISMKHVSKSVQQQIEDYLKANPRLQRELERVDTYTRRIYMQRLAMQLGEGSNSISIQPSSYLLSKDGQKFKFIKASNIPVSPENIIVEPEKRYYFKVYFEKLTPGVEAFDIIENEVPKVGSMTYWNFFGVEVNNPAIKSTDESPQVMDKANENVMITLAGKVLDRDNYQPISAKIVCIAQDSNQRFDSLTTSRSGKYEFIISPDSYLYVISADGYENSEEAFDLSYLKQAKLFERDFYLTPIKEVNSEVPPMVEDTIEEEPEVIIEDKEPVLVNENTFRLNKVYFELGQSTLLESSYEQLDGLAEMMLKKTSMKIQVEGHTDNQGDSKLNKKLSIERAFNVRKYLISKGIAGDRIKFKGYGDTKPIASNSSEESRQQNRRVEFKIL